MNNNSTFALPNVVRMESQLTCDKEYYDLVTVLDGFMKEHGVNPTKITCNFDTHRKIRMSVQAHAVYSEDFSTFNGIPYECIPQQPEKWILNK